MKLINLLLTIFLLSGCSIHAVDMAAEPTVQEFDLSDNEKDGVIAARDLCPDSHSGSAVDINGCGSESLEKIRRQLLVNFTTNSSVVAPRYYPEIKKLADFMKEFPSATVTIEGHTSIRGKAEYNKKLSMRRAKAIKTILVDKYQIDAQRITAVGYGFERLLLEGDDEYIHARNRRIVAEIEIERSVVDMKWTIYSVDDPIE